MMWRRLSYFSVVAAVLLAGCTLYMDEAEQLPEEQRGYDEAVHEVNDTVDVTYQFQTDTRNLTDHVQEYLVRVEADTILYFMDNTPIDYLPQPGGHVFSHSTDKLPWGLMHTVESAAYENGLYRVVCTAATVKEVFKTLKLEVNRPVDYSKARIIAMPDSTDGWVEEEDEDPYPFEPMPEAVDMDDEGNIIDPALLPQYSPHLAHYYTRADNRDGEHDSTAVNTFEIDFDSRNISDVDIPDDQLLWKIMRARRLPSFLKGGLAFSGKKSKAFKIDGKDAGINKYGNWYWKLTWTRTNSETSHMALDSDKETFDYYIDEETSNSFALEVGYSAGAEKHIAPGRWLLDRKERAPSTIVNQTVDGPEVAFPVWGPFSIVIDTSIDFDIHIDLCGQLTYTRTTFTRKGMSFKDGKITRIDKKLESKTTNKVALNFMGAAKAEASAHVGVGLRIGRGLTLDATFGGYVTACMEMKGTKGLAGADYEQQPISDNTYFHAYVQRGLELGLKISFLRTTVYSKKFPILLVKMLAEHKSYPYPKINYKRTWVNNVTDGGFGGWDFSDEVDFQMGQTFSDLGFFAGTMGFEYVPQVDVYDTSTGEYVYTAMPADNENNDNTWPLRKDVNYLYEYDLKSLKPDVLYKAVPCLLRDDAKFVYPAIYFTSATPSVVFSGGDGAGYKQVYSTELKDDTYGFSVAMNVLINGASKIKKWGIKVKIYTMDNDLLLTKELEVSQVSSKTYKLLLEIFGNFTEAKVSMQPYFDEILSDNTKKRQYGSLSELWITTDQTKYDHDVWESTSNDYDIKFNAFNLN